MHMHPCVFVLYVWHIHVFVCFVCSCICMYVCMCPVSVVCSCAYILWVWGMFMCLYVCWGGYVHVFVCMYFSLPHYFGHPLPTRLLFYFPIKNSVEIILILKKFTLHQYFPESLFQTRASLFHLLKAVLYTKRLYRQ